MAVSRHIGGRLAEASRCFNRHRGFIVSPSESFGEVELQFLIRRETIKDPMHSDRVLRRNRNRALAGAVSAPLVPPKSVPRQQGRANPLGGRDTATHPAQA